MRYALLTIMALTMTLGMAVHPAHAEETHAELLTQVQAADVLSDLLTWTGNRAIARVNAMSAFLKETGKLDAFTASKTPPVRIKSIDYSALFEGAAQFIKDGGAQYADPGLNKLTDSQLLKELTALQSYNIQQFLYLNSKRESAATMKTYLDSIQQFDAYTTWAAKNAPQAIAATGGDAKSGATQPTALAPEQIVARAEQLVKSTRAAAWKQAQAKGMSQVDFDRQWAEKKAAFQASVAQRVEGMSKLAQAFASSGASSNTAAPVAPQTGPQEGARYIPPVPAAGTTAGYVPPVQSPGAFQSPDQSFNSWNDPYSDSFNTTYQGAGIYESNDTRVNDENDQRVNGEYDRRTNLNFDRRENVQIDIRQGV